jgi:hypothetical protein
MIQGTGKCPEHTREARARRPREPFYGSAKWRAVRKQYLERNPVCEEPGCDAASTDVHHIDGNVEHLSYRNLEGLCHSHHSRRTATGRDRGKGTLRRNEVLIGKGQGARDAVAYNAFRRKDRQQP